MSKKLSKQVSNVDHRRAGRRRGRRVHRLPVLEDDSSPRCRRGSPRATAGSRPSWSTSPPRSRCGSRRSSSTRAISSSRARCWCGWTPSRSRPSWPRPRRASPPPRSSWRSPRPPSSSRRARSSSPRSRSSAPRKLVEERAGSQRELDVRKTTLETTTAALAEARGEAADRQAGGRGRAGERGDDPDPHRRRDAQVPGHRPGAVSPGRAGEVLGCRRQGADAGEPGRRLHGDLPALGAGRRA